MRKSWLSLTLVGILFYIPAVSAGNVYRWVDEHGRVTFSDRPQDGRATQKIELEGDTPSAPDASANASDSKNPPAAPTSNTTASDTEPLMQADAAKQQHEIREKNCALAREALTHNEGLHRMYRPDPDGERTYLSDEEREQVLKQSRDDVKAWCD
jgi:hypothetical protein